MTSRSLSKFLAVLFSGFLASIAIAQSEDTASADGASETPSFYAGREEEYARALAIVEKSFKATRPYDHQINDALVKATMTALQFAKNEGKLEEYVDHDIQTLRPILERRGKEIEETGNLEIALDSLTETGCFYQLMADGFERVPGKITWTSPYKRVLEASTRLGQHDMTEQDIHEAWTKPRFERYGDILGVKLDVSDWSEDGVLTVTIVPESS